MVSPLSSNRPVSGPNESPPPTLMCGTLTSVRNFNARTIKQVLQRLVLDRAAWDEPTLCVLTHFEAIVQRFA